MSHAIDQEVLDRIATYDVPTISNAIEFFGLRSRIEGFAGPSVRSMFAESITRIGFASTAKVSASQPPTDDQKGLLGQHFESVREAPKPTLAVIQDTDQRPVGSFWGEVNATVHLSLGCVGVVTNGGVRDLEEVRSLGFGYYASCVLVSHGYIHVEAVGVPVTIDGLAVNPGDLLAADQHGVVSIPLEIANRLPAACAHAAAAERPVLDPCERLLKEGKLADVNDLVSWRKEMVKLRNSFQG
mgnify:CR=1 FL=1